MRGGGDEGRGRRLGEGEETRRGGADEERRSNNGIVLFIYYLFVDIVEY